MSVLFGLAAATTAFAGICALCWAIGRLDDRLDRRAQARTEQRTAADARAVVAAAEMITRTAASSRTDKDQP